MKHTLGLALVSLLIVPLACSSNNGFGDDSNGDDSATGDESNPDDDGGTPGDDGSMPPPANAPLATGLTITDIGVFQAVKAEFVVAGVQKKLNAPIVAGRKGLVRVYVTEGTGWTTHSVTGVLTLHTGGTDHVYTASLTPNIASTDANFNSTFNFNVDAAGFGTDTTFLVQIKDPKGTGTGDTTAQYPKSGTPTPMGVKASGGVKINIYPIKFSSGGGTTATGATDIAAYQQIVLGMYPATDVTLTVESTLTYSGGIPTAGGSNWSSLLNFMLQKRAADPSPDAYYYGAFAPSSSFASFCGGGCVAGLSSVPSGPQDSAQKASIGLVYGGDANDQQATGQTMAHEVGHGHGREHSPTTSSQQYCSTPQGIDPGYPYSYGSIGVWGYNITSGQLYDPTLYYDIMGYCSFDWISDYTYSALFQWVAADDGADVVMPKTATTYRMIVVAGDGTLTVGDAFPAYGLLTGAPHTVTYVDHGITHTATGHYYPYDHVPGGYILAPEPNHFDSISVTDFSKAPALLAH